MDFNLILTSGLLGLLLLACILFAYRDYVGTKQGKMTVDKKIKTEDVSLKENQPAKLTLNNQSPETTNENTEALQEQIKESEKSCTKINENVTDSSEVNMEQKLINDLKYLEDSEISNEEKNVLKQNLQIDEDLTDKIENTQKSELSSNNYVQEKTTEVNKKNVSVDDENLSKMENSNKQEVKDTNESSPVSIKLSEHSIIGMSTLNKQAKIFMNKGMYRESLIFLDKSLDISMKNNIEALDLRNECYKQLGEEENLLEGIFLKEQLTNVLEDKEYKSQLQNSIVKKKTEKFIDVKGLKISKYDCANYFSSWIGVLPKKDNKISKMIKDKNFEALDKALMEDNWMEKYKKCSEGFFTIKSVRASLFFLKGLFKESLDVLKDTSTIFDRLLKSYFSYFLQEQTYTLSESDIKEIETSNNPTMLLFLSKCNYLGGKPDKIYKITHSLSEYEFTYFEFLNYCEKTGLSTLFYKYGEEGIQKFGYSASFIFLIAEYILKQQNYIYLNYLLENMDNRDPRFYIIKAKITIKRVRGNIGLSYLNEALKLDPTNFEAHYTKAVITSQFNLEKSIELYKEALEWANNREQVVKIFETIFELTEKNIKRKAKHGEIK